MYEPQQVLFEQDQHLEALGMGFIGQQNKPKRHWLPATMPAINDNPPSPLPEWYKPRLVQVKMEEGLDKAFNDGNDSPLVMAMTASGKTLFTAAYFHRLLTENPAQRLLFSVPRIDLVDQAMEEFKSLDLFPSVIWRQDDRFEPSAQIHIASIDTLLRRLKSKDPRTKEFFEELHFDMAAIDEAHLGRKDLDLIPHTKRFGLSASPFTKGLGLTYQPLVKTLDTDKLIEENTIKPYWPIASVEKADTSAMDVTSTGEYSSKSQDMQFLDLTGNFISDLKTDERLQNRKWIAFTDSIKVCTYFYDELRAEGFNVGIIHSKMNGEERKQILADSKKGLYDGLVSVIALREGYSDKEVNMVVWLTSLAPSKHDPSRPNNLNGWVQGNGRGGRANDGDKDCIVLDYGDNWMQYGSPYRFVDGLEKLSTTPPNEKEKATESMDKTPKPIECNECHSLIEKGNECEFCGNVVESATQWVDGKEWLLKDGELISLSEDGEISDPKHFSIQQKESFYQGIKFIADEMEKKKGEWPKKQGFIAVKYKEVFSDWPPKWMQNLPSQYDQFAQDYMDKSKADWLQQQRRKGYAKAKANKAVAA